MVPTYGPRVTVTVTKLIARADGQAQPYSGSIRTVELTPALGDSGVVQTTKAIDQPAGAFTISWADMPTSDGVSYLDLLEPMDMVEIRASRVAYQYAGGKLPLIMRGLISTVSLTEEIGDDDTPHRVATIAGQDFGKLWQIHSLWYELRAATDQPLLDQLQFQAVTGIGLTALDANDFMTAIVQKAMNAKIADMSGVADQVVPSFTAACSVPVGVTITAMTGSLSGTYWGMVERFADRPWNELFIAEGEAGPVFTFRPVPYRDLQGNYIMAGATDPGTMTVSADEIRSIAMSRTDAGVANFFWVPPGDSTLDNSQYINAGALVKGSLFQQGYANNEPKLYGEKRMDATMQLMPGTIKQPTATLPAGQRPAQQQDYVTWHLDRAMSLQLLNRDNGVLESGTVELAGRETYVPGQYLQITRGSVVTTAYCTAVNHTIAPFGRWTSSLALVRGDGFLQRQAIGSQSFYAAGRDGPYSVPNGFG